MGATPLLVRLTEPIFAEQQLEARIAKEINHQGAQQGGVHVARIMVMSADRGAIIVESGKGVDERFIERLHRSLDAIVSRGHLPQHDPNLVGILPKELEALHHELAHRDVVG